MKRLLRNSSAALLAAILISSFLCSQKAFAQDSLLSYQNFKKGVLSSSMSVETGYQSATIGWSGASYPSLFAGQAGYLLIYSTGTPSLLPSPDGLAPDNAVLNGTVVPTNAAALPHQPATFATAKGLTDGTTYHFMIAAYVWDGIHASSYRYSLPATICAAIPPDQPDSMSLPSTGTFSNSISGSFAQPLFVPDGYVVCYSKNSTAPALSDGSFYEAGQVFEGDTVIQVGNATSFSTINSGYQLSSTTTYYIHVFSYVLSGCNNKPVYSKGYLSYDHATSSGKNQDTASKQESFIEMIDIEPNPVQSNSWLKIATLKNDNHVAVEVFAADGKIVAQKMIQVQAGVNRIRLQTASFSKGMYILTVIFSNGVTKAIQFIKQ